MTTPGKLRECLDFGGLYFPAEKVNSLQLFLSLSANDLFVLLLSALGLWWLSAAP
jgi:hypothetical protein